MSSDFLFPQGRERAQSPARFAGIVKKSDMYMETGSFFSPNLKAAAGVLGVSMKSAFLKIFSRSSFISAMTFRALS